eukprot:TRINITY_DN5179_c0_g1_i3.p1 TRINITY_DN5179_c0_g1~~TRINITY_DN5179_c0_g1_i3.p1  ORF type:complete len:273 (+),score=64.17 TRINITY_DN5179_c0_g1_i3:72-890(+)
MEGACPVSGKSAASGASCPVAGKFPAGATCPVSRTGGLDFTVICPDGVRYPVKNMLPQMPLADFSQILRISGIKVKKEWLDLQFFSPKNLFSPFPADSSVADCIYKPGQVILMSFRDDIASVKKLKISVPMRTNPILVSDYHPTASIRDLKKSLSVFIAPGRRIGREELHIALKRRPRHGISDHFVLNDLKDGDELILSHRPQHEAFWTDIRFWCFVALVVLVVGINLLIHVQSERGLFSVYRYYIERYLLSVGGSDSASVRGSFSKVRSRV